MTTLRVIATIYDERDNAPLSHDGAPGILRIQPGPFGLQLVAVRDGRESMVPVDTARILFGDGLIRKIKSMAGIATDEETEP